MMPNIFHEKTELITKVIFFYFTQWSLTYSVTYISAAFILSSKCHSRSLFLGTKFVERTSTDGLKFSAFRTN